MFKIYCDLVKKMENPSITTPRYAKSLFFYLKSTIQRATRLSIDPLDSLDYGDGPQITPYPEEVTEGKEIRSKAAWVDDCAQDDTTTKAGELAIPYDNKPMVLALVLHHG